MTAKVSDPRPIGLQNPMVVRDLYVVESDLIHDVPTAVAVSTALPKLISKAVTHADFTAAALTEAIDFDDAIPAKAIVMGAWFDLDEVFAGTDLDAAVVDLGIKAGDEDGYVDAEDAFTGADLGQRTTLVNAPALFVNMPLDVDDAARTPQLTLTCTTTAATDLTDLTTGEVTFYILYVEVPNGTSL